MARKTEHNGNILECTCCGKMKFRGQFRNKNRVKPNGKDLERFTDRKLYLDYISEKSSHCKECEKPGVAARHATRRAVEKAAQGRYTSSDVQEMMFTQQGRCLKCGGSLVVKGYHVDHRVPLSKGGRNDRSNLQLLCPPCNLSKGAKMTDAITVTTEVTYAANA